MKWFALLVGVASALSGRPGGKTPHTKASQPAKKTPPAATQPTTPRTVPKWPLSATPLAANPLSPAAHAAPWANRGVNEGDSNRSSRARSANNRPQSASSNNKPAAPFITTTRTPQFIHEKHDFEEEDDDDDVGGGMNDRDRRTPLILVARDESECARAAAGLAPQVGGRGRRFVIREKKTPLLKDYLSGTRRSDADVVFATFEEASKCVDALRREPLSVLIDDGHIENEALHKLRDATKFEIPPSCANVMIEAARLDALARRDHASPLSRFEDVKLDFGLDTFFLSLTYDDLREPGPVALREFGKEVDMLEIRADLLASTRATGLCGGSSREEDAEESSSQQHWSSSPDKDAAIASRARELCSDVVAQISALRANLRNAGCGDVPLLFTARSQCQCGALVDDAAAVRAVAALGLRAGVEYFHTPPASDVLLLG